MSAMTGLWPTRCAQVNYDDYEPDRASAAYAELGDLLWDPKGGEGHVLTREVKCGQNYKTLRWGNAYADCGCGGWGLQPCPSTTLVCECGEDNSFRDHHYYILARAPRSA